MRAESVKEIAAEAPDAVGSVLVKEADLLTAIRAEDFRLEGIVKRFYS